MTFDHEGHIVVTPAEVEAMFRTDVDRLICTALLPGTPVVFATHDEFCRFRAMVAEELSVTRRASSFVEARRSGSASHRDRSRPGWRWRRIRTLISPSWTRTISIFLTLKSAGGNAIQQ